MNYKQVLKNKQFLKYILSTFIDRLGDSIDAIALSWLVYEVTQSGFWSTLIFGVNFLPTILLTPLIAPLIEKLNKKKVIIISQFIRGTVVAGLFFCVTFNFINAYVILVFTILISTVEAFASPAYESFFPLILKKEEYNHGISLLRSVSSICQLIGLAVGGIIVGLLGTKFAIAFDAFSFFASALIILFVKVLEEKKTSQKNNYLSDLKDGFKYILQRKDFINIIVLALILNGLLVPFNGLRSNYVAESLNLSGGFLAVIGISLTVGTLIGSICIPFFLKKMKPGFLIFLTLMIIVLFHLNLYFMNFYKTLYWIYINSIFIFFILGFFVTLLSGFINIYILKKVDTSILARVSSIITASVTFIMPVISLISAILSIYFKPYVIFLFIGGALFLISFIYLFKIKFFNQLEVQNE